MPLPSTLTPIANITVGTAVASVSFSNIPQNYTDLVIVTSAIANVTGADLFVTYFNGDNSGTTYSFTQLYGGGSGGGGAGVQRTTNQNGFVIGWLSTYNSTEWSPSIFNIMNYSNTTTHKSILLKSGNSGTTGGSVDLSVGTWRNTAAITSIGMRTVNGYYIKSGSTFGLYGIKAA